MKLVKPGFEIMAAYGHPNLAYSYDRPEELIEAAARICYKSEDKAWKICPECGGHGTIVTGVDVQAGHIVECNVPCATCEGGRFPTSAHKMVTTLRRRGHLAMLEHSWIVWKWEGDGPWAGLVKFLNINEWGYIAGNLRAMEEAGFASTCLDVVPPRNTPNKPALQAMTVKIICDRGVSHEIVRHRPASYAQESTRYCNYGGGVTFVIPPWVNINPGEYPIIWGDLYGDCKELASGTSHEDHHWFWSSAIAERDYVRLLKHEWSPQQARAVLPNSTKTEIVITASLAEWQHIFRLRCDKAAHPQMREIMIPLREAAQELYPGVFWPSLPCQ